MAYILNIHTATETAIINLTAGKEIVDVSTSNELKQHASFLHTGIRDLVKKNGINLKDLNAVGVSIGPGSYTGIRVGLATAKGLCYALNIPLIVYNTLELIALTAINYAEDAEGLYCPTIDARRMEVYAALYNYNMVELKEPYATIIHKNSFDDILSVNKIYFSGSGREKFKAINENSNAVFINEEISSKAIAIISIRKFQKKVFENITQAEPLYIKEFYTF